MCRVTIIEIGILRIKGEPVHSYAEREGSPLRSIYLTPHTRNELLASEATRALQIICLRRKMNIRVVVLVNTCATPEPNQLKLLWHD